MTLNGLFLFCVSKVLQFACHFFAVCVSSNSVNTFIDVLKKYIHYYNNERISLKLKGMSPVQYRTHSLTI